jgi:23S rRNA (guanosine2251-2'-O)-methyltransferase
LGHGLAERCGPIDLYLKQNCDFLVSIPQQGALNSLNASVAAAVAMYEAFRQRNNE